MIVKLYVITIAWDMRARGVEVICFLRAIDGGGGVYCSIDESIRYPVLVFVGVGEM